MRHKVAYALAVALAGLLAAANPANAAHCGACAFPRRPSAPIKPAYQRFATASAIRPWSRSNRNSATDPSITPS